MKDQTAEAGRSNPVQRLRRPFGVGVVALVLFSAGIGCSGDDASVPDGSIEAPTVQLMNEAIVRIDTAGLPFGNDARMRELEIESEAALNSDPTDRDALFTTGTLALARSDAETARGRLDTLVQLGEAAPPAHYNLGVANLVLNDSGAAKTAFEAALAIDDEYALAMLQLGYILIAEGDAVRGVDLVIEAAELDPTLRSDASDL